MWTAFVKHKTCFHVQVGVFHDLSNPKAYTPINSMPHALAVHFKVSFGVRPAWSSVETLVTCGRVDACPRVRVSACPRVRVSLCVCVCVCVCVCL